MTEDGTDGEKGNSWVVGVAQFLGIPFLLGILSLLGLFLALSDSAQLGSLSVSVGGTWQRIVLTVLSIGIPIAIYLLVRNRTPLATVQPHHAAPSDAYQSFLENRSMRLNLSRRLSRIAIG